MLHEGTRGKSSEKLNERSLQNLFVEKQLCFAEFKALHSFSWKNKIIPPLHALLQLSLLADLGELFLVVFSHLALLGSASWVVFDALYFLLPRFHQLVVALAKFLFLKPRRKKYTQPGDTSADIFFNCRCGDLHAALMKPGLWGCREKKESPSVESQRLNPCQRRISGFR